MSEIPNVVSGEPVESAWGNAIRDRVAQRYNDATARDVSVLLPGVGELAWLDDPGVLTIYTGAEWETLTVYLDPDAGFVLRAGDTMTGTLRAPQLAANQHVETPEIVDPSSVVRLSLIAGGSLQLRDDAGLVFFEWDATSDLVRGYVNGTEVLRLRDYGPSGAAIQADDGGVAVPAFAFISDTDTGIYRESADTLGITVGGAAVVVVGGFSVVVRGPNTDLVVEEGTLSLLGQSTRVLQYENARTVITGQRDAVFEYAGVGNRYRLVTLESLANLTDPVVDGFLAVPEIAAELTVAGSSGDPTHRELIRALIAEVMNLRARVDNLEAP